MAFFAVSLCSVPEEGGVLQHGFVAQVAPACHPTKSEEHLVACLHAGGLIQAQEGQMEARCPSAGSAALLLSSTHPLHFITQS